MIDSLHYYDNISSTSCVRKLILTIHGDRSGIDPTASFMLNPPTAFNFRQVKEWNKFLTRFEQFRIASRLSTKSGERQVSALLYCMGVEDVDIISYCKHWRRQEEKLQQGGEERSLMNISKCKHTIFEHGNFNLVSQLADKTLEQFITRLYQMADNCKFSNMRSKLSGTYGGRFW